MTKCPGCSGEGVLTDDPQILCCTSCGGVFTGDSPIMTPQAIKFVNLHLPMQASSTDGDFYFDFWIMDAGGTRRVHGWADRVTKRVIQWGVINGGISGLDD